MALPPYSLTHPPFTLSTPFPSCPSPLHCLQSTDVDWVKTTDTGWEVHLTPKIVPKVSWKDSRTSGGMKSSATEWNVDESGSSASFVDAEEPARALRGSPGSALSNISRSIGPGTSSPVEEREALGRSTVPQSCTKTIYGTPSSTFSALDNMSYASQSAGLSPQQYLSSSPQSPDGVPGGPSGSPALAIVTPNTGIPTVRVAMVAETEVVNAVAIATPGDDGVAQIARANSGRNTPASCEKDLRAVIGGANSDGSGDGGRTGGGEGAGKVKVGSRQDDEEDAAEFFEALHTSFCVPSPPSSVSLSHACTQSHSCPCSRWCFLSFTPTLSCSPPFAHPRSLSRTGRT